MTDVKPIFEQLKRQCLRCGSTWYIRGQREPIRCPRCQSPSWNRLPPEQANEQGGKPE